MALSYKKSQEYQGKVVQFRDEKGEWIIGKVVKVEKDGMDIEEFNQEKMEEGFGYGFFGRRPLFGPRPFVLPYRRYPFLRITGFSLLPFFFW